MGVEVVELAEQVCQDAEAFHRGSRLLHEAGCRGCDLRMAARVDADVEAQAHYRAGDPSCLGVRLYQYARHLAPAYPYVVGPLDGDSAVDMPVDSPSNGKGRSHVRLWELLDGRPEDNGEEQALAGSGDPRAAEPTPASRLLFRDYDQAFRTPAARKASCLVHGGFQGRVVENMGADGPAREGAADGLDVQHRQRHLDRPNAALGMLRWPGPF